MINNNNAIVVVVIIILFNTLAEIILKKTVSNQCWNNFY